MKLLRVTALMKGEQEDYLKEIGISPSEEDRNWEETFYVNVDLITSIYQDEQNPETKTVLTLGADGCIINENINVFLGRLADIIPTHD